MIEIELTTNEITVETQTNEINVSLEKQGARGVGIVEGGNAGQVLAKKSDDDFDVEWQSKTSLLSTDELPEGENNLYFTEERGREAVEGLYDDKGTAEGLVEAHEEAFDHSLIATALQSETDPIFSAWLLNTPPLYSESDPIFSSWLLNTPPIYSETDPVFTAWDKSTGISITESQISDFKTYIQSLEKGANNGVATLDSGGKVPTNQLPSTLLIYKGVWNATTNTPELLATDTTKKGFVYNVAVAGTQFDIDWKLGDWAIYNDDGVLEKSDNSDDVVSVNGQQGVVVLDTDDISEGSNNLYYTINRTADNFLKLNQTTPQTTVGRFTFPALTVDTNTLFVDSTNHRIGVGTTEPNALFTLKQSDDTIANGFRLYNSDGTRNFSFYINPLAQGGNPRFSSNSGMVFEATNYVYLRGASGIIINDDNNKNVRMVSGGGNVGIGSDPTPLLKLDVFGRGAFGSRASSRNSYGNTLSLVNEANTDTSVFFWQSGQASGHIGFASGSSVLRIVNSQTDGLITNNNALYLLGDGKFGIGDISPQRKVEIASDTDASLYLRRSSTTTDAYSELLFGVSTSDVYNNSIRSIRQSSGLSDLAIFSNTTGSAYNTLFEALRIKNTTGYVGIGNTTPTNKLDVRGTASTDSIRSAIGFDIYPVPNPTTPTGVAISGSGLEIGGYYYLVTYYTSLGETNSVLSAQINTTSGNQAIQLTIPVSTDPRVIGRKIYRSKVNSFGYLDYILTTVANNTDTTYTDTTPDASLTGSSGASYFRMNTTSNQITVGGVKSMAIDTNNTAFGYLSLSSITTGGRNTVFGYGAGRAITTATSNALFGDRTGWNNTTGVHNVGINYQALFNNTTGSYNTGIGTNSLLYNQTGNNNIAIGFYTLAGVSGNNHSNNVSVGNYSGYLITTGQYNTFLAHNAGYNITTGSYNLYSGYNAGRFIADGSTANQTSSFGVYLGTETKASADGASNEIVIGYNAIGNGSNTVTIGNTSILANYFSGQLIPGKISSAPTAIEGGIYFNTTDKHFYGYNGTDWKQLDN